MAVGPGAGWAVILDTRTREEGCYAVGTAIGADTRLVAVERSRALLETAGRRCYVTFDDGGGTGGGLQTGPSISPAAGPVATDPTAERQVVAFSEEDIEKNVANLSQLFSQIRFAPYFEGGRQRGFKILSVRSGSFPERVGARAGDVVQAVDGTELTSVRAAFDLFRDSQDRTSISLSVLRDGKPLVIEVRRQ